jgi:hypothetical protein
VPFIQMRYIEIEYNNLESEMLNFCLYSDAINDYISHIDLISINCKLMNEATTHGNNKEGKLH